MCPIFKNVDIPFEAIGEQVQNFVEQNGLSKKPRRGLIGSMFGNKILLTTPLLRWYINHGLKFMKLLSTHQKIVSPDLQMMLAMRIGRGIATLQQPLWPTR